MARLEWIEYLAKVIVFHVFLAFMWGSFKAYGAERVGEYAFELAQFFSGVFLVWMVLLLVCRVLQEDEEWEARFPRPLYLPIVVALFVICAASTGLATLWAFHFDAIAPDAMPSSQ